MTPSSLYYTRSRYLTLVTAQFNESILRYPSTAKIQLKYRPGSFEYKGTFAISMVPQDKDTALLNDFARETFDKVFSDR